MPRSRALSEVVASETNNMSQSQRSQSQRGLSQSQSQREDERQSASEHSKLRKRLESNKGALVNPRSNELQTEIRQANELMESVPAHSTRELNRNFSVFSRMAELAVEQAQLGERNTSKFTLDTLGVKLASAYTRNHEKLDEIEDEEDRMEHMREHFDWEALGRRNNIFLAAPTVEFMTAPMGLKVKERKTIKRQKRGVVGPKVKPTELKDTEQVNEEHTELMVEIKKSVHGHGKFQLFWPFVLQGDLGSTILRIFACCFLAREVSAPNACCLLARLAGCRAPLSPPPPPPPLLRHQLLQLLQSPDRHLLVYACVTRVAAAGVGRRAAEHAGPQRQAAVPAQGRGRAADWTARQGGERRYSGRRRYDCRSHGTPQHCGHENPRTPACPSASVVVCTRGRSAGSLTSMTCRVRTQPSRTCSSFRR
eukprot:COSAG01_NODE_769_length_13735_cov_41.389410_11_plen_424_part_00